MNIIEITNSFCFNYLACIRRITGKLNITTSQILCLHAIPFEGITQTDLAKKLSVDISTLSRNLDKLILSDMVYKNSSNADRRSYRISLTSGGQKLYSQFNDLIQTEIGMIYNQLEAEEYDQLHEILNKLNWQLELSNK
tara:strand:+ start:150 stop:566 length:417 start_codon:yes stop_codon:yes gene_type:complete